uniref:mucin-2-like isoform X14 n=1 Tax=Pristiophorus japonicus TaxID=55135 RepID=UPI00398E3CE9
MGKLVLVVLWALSLCRGLQSESARNVPRSLEETTSDSSSGFCSTWGNGAFRTFDDKFYHFTSTCNYILSRQCTGGTEDFNIQIHRGSNGNMEHIYIQMEGVKIVVVNGTISVQDVIIRLPHHDKVIGIYKRGIYTQLSNRKHTISVNWNSEDALWITLDDKYQGQVCGLCGKFEKDSSSTYDSTFFDANKLDVLGHTCYSNPQSGSTCAEKSQCEAISELFLSCFGNTVIGQYWKMCNADVCSCKVPGCKCATFAEIARQCNKDNMRENWRTHTKCTQPTCPGDQIFKECGPACIPTCTDPNPQQQCDQCVNTCDCPEGNVLDNVRGTNRCISKRECPCEYSGDIYQSGEIRNTSCQSCICKSGKWSCSYHSCPGRCTIEEGTYLTTFDNTYYSMVGDCSYYAVFTEDWTIKVELRQCQAAFKQTCLQRVTLTKNLTTCMFSNDGSVYFDGRKVAFPLRTGEIIVFQQSLIYIQVATTFGLKMQVQISPVMQLYISLPVAAKGSTKGLCGTFNDDAEDDFLSAQGIVEGTPITFANSWKADDSCSEAKIPSPCVSSENENFAKQHCSQLKDPTGAFSVCHSAVDYLKYYQMCVAATCGCENIEDCLCAGLGAYVHECAANGVIVRNWRREICNKPCANTQVFENDMRACNRTCRSLSEYDYTCGVQDVPVYGCGCPERKYMDNTGACIDKSDCSCYIGELIIKRGQSVTLNGRTCTCENGKPYCPTVPTTTSPGCLNGKVFYDCSNTILNQKSNEKKCRSRSIPSENTQCVPGCVCPDDLVEDDSGRCIAAEQCPCLFGGESHPTGKTIQRDCNKCTCKAGVWHCTTHPCPKTCQVHGDGQYVTFDGKRYMFDGNCEYIFAEDHCNQGIGTFQILTEGVPCCENGVTCSRNIKIFLAGKQFILMDGRVVRAEKSGQTQCTDDSYSLHTVGLYLILTFSNGITVIWDKRTRLSITLDPRWKKKVCGLCGNFNDDVSDDLTTKGNSLVTSTVKFGSSWKSSLSCSDTLNQTFPCDRNPYCLAWAQRKCSIMKDAVFQKCHKKVDPTPYYDACVQEACACDMEGKYLGFCTAVAVYAEVCNKAGVCIDWRTPDLCPVYCDYYNKPDECSWHYHPCGTLTTKTCSDHYIGKKFSAVLEGCYAKCPESAPYLDENKMKCVNLSECTCYHNGKILQPGKGTRNDCEECECKNGKVTCIALITSTTTTSISTSPSIVTTSATTTTELPCYGIWSSWSDDYILSPISHGNSASLDPIRNKLCPSASYNIGNIQHQCIDTSEPISNSENNVTCDDDVGLISTNNEDDSLDANKCSYYRTRICCEPATVSPTTSPPRTSTPETTSPEVIPITTTSTTSFEYETMTPEVIPIITTSTTSYTTETTTPGVIPITTTSTTSFEYETTTPEVIPITTTSTTSYTTETTTPGVIPITTTSTTSFEYETTTPEVIPITTTSTTSYTTETTTPGVIPITTTSTTSFEYESTTEVVTEPTTEPFTTPEVFCNGEWSGWFNENTPSMVNKGDSELLEPMRNSLCPFSPYKISDIDCEAVKFPQRPISETKDNVTCDINKGLICNHNEQNPENHLTCLDYRIRVCCEQAITTSITPTTTIPTVMHTTSEPMIIPFTEPPLESCLCNVKPPRKCMETWKENCTMITCIKNDLFKMDPIVCPALIKPTCNNEIEPVKIRTENGCCEKWECDCECEIWGDPHYRTFDGQWYDFFENCTYTLVEERVPKYNFSVLVDNYFCLSLVKKSCPKGLVISYNGNVVYISTGGVYVLTVNGNDVSLPYSSKGFKIIKPGGSTYISIPDIRTSITAFRNAFTIRVPEKYFFNNTKGQCGSCSHTPAQCTRKNGKVEPSDCCHKTAYDWRVDDPTKPYCQSAPNNVPCAPVPPPPTCKTEKTICDIIQEKPFEQCRRKINLDKYIKICTFDHCALNGTIDCSSLEAAASACASKGVCVDWRSFTNGLCRYPCDQGLVYKPCQNKGDDQCESHVVIAGDTFIPMLEGCFCPDGLILSEDKSKCVASCAGCRDNLGHPRKEGETWEDAEDPCVSYLCTPYGVVTSNRSCSQDESCPESHRIYIDRCCFICKIPIGNCKISTFNETVRKGNCEATFEMRQCSGLCSSATRYDFQRNHMDHDCHCCHEHETEKMSVKLHCKNGSTKKAKYIAIKTCMCKNCEKGKSN